MPERDASNENSQRAPARRWQRSLGWAALLLSALATAAFCQFVLWQSKHDVEAMFPSARQAQKVTFAGVRLRSENVALISWQWSNERGAFTAYWGLRQWRVVNAPGSHQEAAEKRGNPPPPGP